MWIFIVLYCLIGAAVAKEQMKDDEDKIDEARKYYPDYMVFTALLIAFLTVALSWPYIAYKALGE